MILAKHLRNSDSWLNEFSRFFDNAFERVNRASFPVRIFQSDSGWSLEAEIPGRTKEDFELEFKEQALHLKLGEEEAYRLPIDKQVDVANITANFESGILTIELPKLAEETKTKNIEIN